MDVQRLSLCIVHNFVCSVRPLPPLFNLTYNHRINNSDPKILTAPIAVIAIQNNYDCSITITQDQANQPVGTGWTVVLANPLNNTDVRAEFLLIPFFLAVSPFFLHLFTYRTTFLPPFSL